jgi:hypothetical protein
MFDRLVAVVDDKVLLADIGDVSGLGILGEQMVKRLVPGRAEVLGNRFVPFLAIGEFGIDVEHHATEVEDPVTHHVADRETRAGHADLVAHRG